MPEPAVLTTAEVAAKLRRSTRWFRAARRRLQARGFPAPLPELSRPPLWSATAVDAWLARQADGGGEARIEAELAERARQIASRKGRRRVNQ